MKRGIENPELRRCPVIYLDVDGVLWDISEDAPLVADPAQSAQGVDGLREFLDWALAHCEVRWCTTWALSGSMTAEQMERLARYTDVDVSVWECIRPSHGWRDSKCEAISWDEHVQGRPFAWLEDGLTPAELHELDRRGFSDSFIHTDVFENPRALREAHAELIRRWEGRLKESPAAL